MHCASVNFMIIITVKENINCNQETLFSLKRKASYIAKRISLDIWFLHTSLWLIPLVCCLLDMYNSLHILSFVEAPFTIMPLSVVFVLKIRYPQKPVKRSQERRVLKNEFGRERQLRYLTCIVTTEFLRLVNSIWTVTTNINSNLSLYLYQRIIIQDQKEQFKLSCIW